MALAITSPSNRNEAAEGIVKNAIRCSPLDNRFRSVEAISSGVPAALESAGNSAAETDMLKRLIGRSEITWP